MIGNLWALMRRLSRRKNYHAVVVTWREGGTMVCPEVVSVKKCKLAEDEPGLRVVYRNGQAVRILRVAEIKEIAEYITPLEFKVPGTIVPRRGF